MMKKTLLSYCLLLIAIISNGQYTPSMSQYMFDQLLINPAYAGNRETTSISAISRNQWIGFDGAPKTQSIIAHSPFMKKTVGLGVSLQIDKIGVNNHTAFFTYYSYRIPIQKGKLSIGLSAGINMIRSNYDKIYTTMPNDIVFENASSYNHVNFGTGLFYKHPKYFIGFSTPFIIDYREQSIVHNNEEVHKLNFILSSGMLFKLNDNFKLKPSILFKTYPDYASQLDINSNLIYNDILWFGLSMRTDDALVWLIEYQISPQLRFGFSHDFPFTEIARFSIGTNEILIRYEFGYKTNATGVKFF